MTTEQHDNIELAQTLAEVDLADKQFARSDSGAEAHVEQVALSEEAIAAVNAERIANYRQKAKAERARGVKSLAVRHEGVAAVIEPVTINVPAVAAILERWYASMEMGIYVVKRRGAIVLGNARAKQLTDAIDSKIAKLEAQAKTALTVVEKALADAELNALTAGMEMLKPTFAKPAAQHEVQMRFREAKKLLEVFKAYDKALTICVTLEWNEAWTSDQIGTMVDEFRNGMKDLSKLLGQTVRGMKNKVSPLDEPAAGEPAANDTAAAVEKAA